jgi:hypothetical protein
MKELSRSAGRASIHTKCSLWISTNRPSAVCLNIAFLADGGVGIGPHPDVLSSTTQLSDQRWTCMSIQGALLHAAVCEKDAWIYSSPTWR